MSKERISPEEFRKGAIPAGIKTRLGYLVGQYPAITHTFIFDEIECLRSLGLDLCIASIGDPDRPYDEMTPKEKDEVATTYYIKSRGALKTVADHLKTILARPIGYCRGLAYALKIGGFDLRLTTSAVFYFAEAVVLGRWMTRLRISHLHSHFSSTVALLTTRIFPITMSMTIHGPAEFDDPKQFRLAEKIKASLFVCAISNYARSQLMRICDPSEWNKIEVAPLGINTEVFRRHSPPTVAETFEILCVGRLASVKAQQILLEVVGCLKRRGRRIRLRLVGDGQDRQRLEHSVVENGLCNEVVFEGWRNTSEIAALYERANVFALASFAEGVPVVLMEAMAMEVPCIATRIMGIPELIRDGIDGLLVAPSNIEEMAAAIEMMIDDEQLRFRLARAGRERVINKYDLSANTENLANIIRRYLSSQDAGGALKEIES